MKILNISLDKSVVDKNSAVARRVVAYGNLVDQYTVLVLADVSTQIYLSDKTKVIAVKKSFCKLWNWFKLKAVARMILQEKFDLITVQDVYFVGLIALLMSKKFHIGLEVQVHGFEKFSGLRKILSQYILVRTPAIRVVSNRLRDLLINRFKVPEAKITVAPIYVAPLVSKSTRFHHKHDKFILLTVGRLVSVKNINMQIAAMQKLSEAKLRQPIELWIVGDGPEKANLKTAARLLKVDGSIRFFSWQKNLEKFYTQADIFLLTSDSEGWAMAAVEAASFGLPIIMTNVGLAEEVIKDGDSGIVIAPGDTQALTQNIIKLINDESLRKKLSINAVNAVKQLPTQEEIWRLYRQSWHKASAHH